MEMYHFLLTANCVLPAASFWLRLRRAMAFLHTPLSPLSRGESQKFEIPKH